MWGAVACRDHPHAARSPTQNEQRNETLRVLCGAPWLAAIILTLLGARIARGGRRILIFSTLFAALGGAGVALSDLETAQVESRWAGWRWLTLSGVDEAGFLHAAVVPEEQALRAALVGDTVGLVTGS